MDSKQAVNRAGRPMGGIRLERSRGSMSGRSSMAWDRASQMRRKHPPESGANGIDRKTLSHARPRRLAHRPPQLGVIEESAEPSGERHGVAARYHDAMTAPVEQVGHAWGVSGHYRQARCHRLHRSHRETFMARRKGEDVSGGQMGGQDTAIEDILLSPPQPP